MGTLSFSSSDLKQIEAHFNALAAKVPLHPIDNDDEYDRAVQAIDALLDAGASDERHPLAPLVAALGEFVREYDDRHFQLGEAVPAEVLRTMMALHDVKQSELTEVGSQGVVSEVLSGKRELNTRQIRALAKRFNISPAVFFPA